MSDKSKIEWTDATWNPVVGCSPVSAGCANCYAISAVKRVGEFQGEGSKYRDLTVVQKNGVRGWSGGVEMFPERLSQPLRWKRGRKIFVNSLSDLWHEAVPFEFVDKIFAVMALASQHTFQVLTKRPERAEEYFRTWATRHKWGVAAREFVDEPNVVGGRDAGCVERVCNCTYPLPNVWLGTSTEDQRTADERIPHLLKCPAVIRFLSMEPLLGPVTLWRYDEDEGAMRGPGVIVSGGMTPGTPESPPEGYDDSQPGIDWVIVGGESGPGARPMAPAWATSLRDQCVEAGVPFFFKQWGAYSPGVEFAPPNVDPTYDAAGNVNGFSWPITEKQRVGKKRAGRMMQGCYWDEFPTVGTVVA